MLIRFLADYQGRLTGERFFLKDTEVDIEDAAAQAIIEEGRAVAVDAPPVPQQAVKRKAK